MCISLECTYYHLVIILLVCKGVLNEQGTGKVRIKTEQSPCSVIVNREYMLSCQFLFLTINKGKNINIPMKDIISPPIVPAASGNQNDSFWVPTMNGMKLRMLDTIVRNIGMILVVHALR